MKRISKCIKAMDIYLKYLLLFNKKDRYLNYLPIIISTEYAIDILLSFDEAIGSRIYEMCKEYIVQIPKNIKNIKFQLRY